MQNGNFIETLTKAGKQALIPELVCIVECLNLEILNTGNI